MDGKAPSSGLGAGSLPASHWSKNWPACTFCSSSATCKLATSFKMPSLPPHLLCPKWHKYPILPHCPWNFHAYVSSLCTRIKIWFSSVSLLYVIWIVWPARRTKRVRGKFPWLWYPRVPFAHSSLCVPLTAEAINVKSIPKMPSLHLFLLFYQSLGHSIGEVLGQLCH